MSSESNINFSGVVSHRVDDKLITAKNSKSKTRALGIADSLVISSGDAKNVTIEIFESDSLNTIADKINSIKAGVRASIHGDDKSGYQLNISGNMVGNFNKLMLSGAGENSLLAVNLIHKHQTVQDMTAKLVRIEAASQTNKIAAVENSEFRNDQSTKQKYHDPSEGMNTIDYLNSLSR